MSELSWVINSDNEVLMVWANDTSGAEPLTESTPPHVQAHPWRTRWVDIHVVRDFVKGMTLISSPDNDERGRGWDMLSQFDSLLPDDVRMVLHGQFKPLEA